MTKFSNYERDFTDNSGFVLEPSGFRVVITKGFRRVKFDYVADSVFPEYGPGPGDVGDVVDGYVWRRIAESALGELVGDTYPVTLPDGSVINGLLQPPVFASPLVQEIKGLRLADQNLRQQGNSHNHTVELHASTQLKSIELDIMSVIAAIPNPDYDGTFGSKQFINVDQFTQAWRNWNDAFMARTLDDATQFIQNQNLTSYKIAGFISQLSFGQEIMRFTFDEGQFTNFEFGDFNATSQDQNWTVSMKLSCLLTSAKTIPNAPDLPA